MTEQRDRLNQRLKDLIGECLAPRLREMGYRKAGFRFTRRCEGSAVSQVIQVQRSQYVVPDETEFTVNGGVYVHGLAFVLYDVANEGKPREPSCPIRIRPGALEDGLDAWWNFSETSTPEQMGGICQDVRRRAGEMMARWLNEFSSPLDVAAHLIATENGPGRTRIGYRDPPQDFQDCINAAACFLLGRNSKSALKWSDLAVKAARMPIAVESMTECRDRIHRLVRDGNTPSKPDD